MSEGANPVAQTITLQPVTPAEPMVVCDSPFLHTLAVVEREVSLIAIRDEAAAQAASNLLQRLTMAGKKLEDVRTKLKAPLLAKGREIDDAARAPAQRIEAAKKALKDRVLAFTIEQEKAARKAEAERQAELQRLEEIRKKEEAAAAQRAAELAKQAVAMPPSDFDFDDGDVPPVAVPEKTETEKLIDAVKFAPIPQASKPVGITTKVFLLIDTIDIDQLPDSFVTKSANEARIRATFCVGYKDGDPIPECRGVRFKIDRQVQSTGRAQF